MRIGIDLFSVVPGTGRGAGFHRYVTGLVEALRELDDDHEYVLIVNRRNAEMFAPGPRFTRYVAPLPPEREVWPFRLLFQHAMLPVVAGLRRLDLLHCPTDTAPLFVPCPYVVTIHDLITDVFYPTRFPGAVNPLKARYLFAAKRRSARRARRVIAVSQATAEAIGRHYGLPRRRISVVPSGVDARFFTQPATAGPRRGATPYVLTVTSLSPHKNIKTVVQAFAEARARYRVPHELRIVGMRGTDADRVQAYLRSEEVTGLPVRYLGFVDETTLLHAYAEAALLVFVPLVEGFGFPPLEAMAAGVPVVASNDGAVADVCGDAAVLVDPSDVQAVAQAIGRVLTAPELARSLGEAGRRRAARFTWARTATETRAVYEAAMAPD